MFNLLAVVILLVFKTSKSAPPTLLVNVVTDHNTIRRNVAQGNEKGCNKQTSSPWCLGASGQYKFPKGTDIYELVWDDNLAAVAQVLADTCKYDHSTSPERQARMAAQSCSYDNGYIGENIAWTSSAPSQTEIDNLVKGWLDEEAINTEFIDSSSPKYKDTNFFCEFDITQSYNPNDQCGHFTQGIWAKTEQIGCAYIDCSSCSAGYCVQFDGTPFSVTTGTFLVCNYYPGGNYLSQNVYTSGSTTCSSCPSDSSCVNGLCQQLPTPSPTPCPTADPTGQTPAPVPGTNSAIYICNLGATGFNGKWEYDSTDANGKRVYTKNTVYTGNANPFQLKPNSASSKYYIYDANNAGPYTYCSQSSLTDCGAGTWTDWVGPDSDATYQTSPCGSPAENNPEMKIPAGLQLKNQSPENNTSYPLNMTEMHIILGLIVVVLITVCGLILGICYYVKRNNKRQFRGIDIVENEMVYFDNKPVNEHNTPTVENLKDNKETQPTLKINVNGAATMVTKLPTTTPVTPLIDIDQNYE